MKAERKIKSSGDTGNELGWRPVRVPALWRTFQNTGEYSALVHVERMEALLKEVRSKAQIERSAAATSNELERLRRENEVLKAASKAPSVTTKEASKKKISEE